MKIFIKNMVCDRCNMVVSQLFEAQGYELLSVRLGEIEIKNDSLSGEQIQRLKHSLQTLGFEWLDDRTDQLVERIKSLIIERVHQLPIPSGFKLSDYIRQSVHHDYASISHLFSVNEGITIEQYFIRQKTERARELLSYDELSASEIAHQLGYSSPAHFSNQFRKLTGMSPGECRKTALDNRTALDKV